jgi:hypothetical protein
MRERLLNELSTARIGKLSDIECPQSWSETPVLRDHKEPNTLVSIARAFCLLVRTINILGKVC